MKRKISKSHPTRARRRFFAESLEHRCLLAGNVDVFVSGGSLFVRGDAEDNAVLIQQEGNGIYSVTGLDFADLELDVEGFDSGPTTINGEVSGEAVIFSGVTNDINVDLKGGNDGLGIGNDIEALDELARDCFGIGFIPEEEEDDIAIEQVEGTLLVPRNLIVNLGDGNDFTAIDANVGTLNPNGSTKKGGVANINAGNGFNGVAFGSEGEGNFVADDLLISGGSGSDNVCVDRTSVRDLLSVQLGNGDGESHQFVEVESVAAGHVLITSGNGSDHVSLGGVGVDREITINTGAGNDTVSIEEFSAGAGDGPTHKNNNSGNVVIVTGNGDDQVGVFGFSVDSLTVDTGSGDDGRLLRGEVEVEQIGGGVTVAFGFVTRQLTLVTGSGDDFATVNNVTAHDIVVDTGSGNDGDEEFPISIYNVFVPGNLTLVTGSGIDFAYIHSGDQQTSNINGNVTVNMGSDDDNFEIIDQTIGKDLTVVLGSGINTAGIGGGIGEGAGEAEGNLVIGRNLTVVGGGNHDLIGLLNVAVRNNAVVDLGAGDDDLFANGLTIGGNATLLGGAGGDSMSINFANIAGNALIDAGSGGDTVSLNFSNVGKTATILMGSGDDTLNIFNSFAKKLIARGGAGTDTFNNDLGITKNGRSSDGSVDVQEFENFNDD